MRLLLYLADTTIYGYEKIHVISLSYTQAHTKNSSCASSLCMMISERCPGAEWFITSLTRKVQSLEVYFYVFPHVTSVSANFATS